MSGGQQRLWVMERNRATSVARYHKAYTDLRGSWMGALLLWPEACTGGSLDPPCSTHLHQLHRLLVHQPALVHICCAGGWPAVLLKHSLRAEARGGSGGRHGRGSAKGSWPHLQQETRHLCSAYSLHQSAMRPCSVRPCHPPCLAPTHRCLLAQDGTQLGQGAAQALSSGPPAGKQPGGRGSASDTPTATTNLTERLLPTQPHTHLLRRAVSSGILPCRLCRPLSSLTTSLTPWERAARCSRVEGRVRGVKRSITSACSRLTMPSCGGGKEGGHGGTHGRRGTHIHTTRYT